MSIFDKTAAPTLAQSWAKVNAFQRERGLPELSPYGPWGPIEGRSYASDPALVEARKAKERERLDALRARLANGKDPIHNAAEIPPQGEETDMSKKSKLHGHKAPKPGAEFEREYKGKKYKLTVVETDDGIGYRVAGKTYGTPSGAAEAVTGGGANGWIWWGIEKREAA